MGIIASLKGRPHPRDYRERFLLYFREDENGCWIWTGKTFRNGYGQMHVNGRCKMAHRVSWEIHNNMEPPENLVVMHKCDVRNCVNPEHLSLGTQTDNMQDMIAKGRQGDIRGEKCGKSKLKEKDVLTIRSLYGSGEYSQKEIAEAYAVSAKQISIIINRKQWKHI